MTWWGYLCVLAATVSFTLAYKQDLFSPARVYICIYSFLLSVNALNLSRIQVPWCHSTLLFFWGASFMFVAGAVMIDVAGKAKFPAWRVDLPAVKAALHQDAARMDWKWFQAVWIACVAIFLASYLASYLVIGVIPVFSSTPEQTRLAFQEATQITYYGLFFGPFSMMLAVEMILFGGFHGIRLKVIYAAFILVTLLFLTIITRFDVFRFFIFLVVLYHYGKKNLKLSHLLLVLVAILAIFISASLIRISQDAIGTLNETIKIKLPRNIAWASGFYAYLANDFWNMNYAFSKFAEGKYFHPHSLGLGMLRAVTLFGFRIEPGLIDTFGYDTIMNPMAERVKGLNTVVYVWHLWKDFGAAGVFAVPMLGGLLLAKFHFNNLRAPTLFRISMYGCIIAIVVLSFHIPIWELWFFHVNLLVMAVAHKKINFAKAVRMPFSRPVSAGTVS